MSLTLPELKEKLRRQLDEVSILEVLEIDVEEILERFTDKVEDKFDELVNEYGDEDGETERWNSTD